MVNNIAVGDGLGPVTIVLSNPNLSSSHFKFRDLRNRESCSAAPINALAVSHNLFSFPDIQQQRRPNAKVDHNIGGIEDVFPIGYALKVDKINDRAEQQAVENIAGAASHDQSEAEVMAEFQCFRPDQVNHESGKQAER